MHVFVPVGQYTLEVARDQAALVDLDGHPAHAVRERRVRERVERELVRQEVVTRAAKEPEALGDTVHVPDGERRDVVSWSVVEVCELCNGALGLGKACAGAVRHRAFERDAAGGIVARAGEDLSAR